MPGEGLRGGGVRVSFFSSLEFIFVISGLLRLVNILVFMPAVHEVRSVGKPELKDIFLMLTHIRPLTGSQFDPYTGDDSNENGNHEG